MVEIGMDSRDPVEPPAVGNVMYAEAREILSLGKERLILGAPAGLIYAVAPTLVENYNAWIDRYLEFFDI